MIRSIKFTAVIMFALISVLMLSCKDSNSDAEGTSGEASSEKVQQVRSEESAQEDGVAIDQQSEVGTIVANYLPLKDALVADNEEAAKEYGAALVTAFDEFQIDQYDQAQQKELKDIIEDAREHSQHISESDIAHQREHFDVLSVDLKDLVAITGTDKKLYQAHCPMYNENKGAIWLSESENIQNPYFGQKMLKCGKIQKEIG